MIHSEDIQKLDNLQLLALSKLEHLDSDTAELVFNELNIRGIEQEELNRLQNKIQVQINDKTQLEDEFQLFSFWKVFFTALNTKNHFIKMAQLKSQSNFVVFKKYRLAFYLGTAFYLASFMGVILIKIKMNW